MSFTPDKITHNICNINTFLSDFHNLTKGKDISDLSILDKIKLFYYIYWRYPRLKRKYDKDIVNSVAHIMLHPEDFIEFLTQCILILISVSSVDQQKINRLIENQFARLGITPSPLKITFETNDEHTILNKYYITLHYLPKQFCEILKYYPNNVFHCIITVDKVKLTANIDTTVLKTTDIYSKQSSILRYKHFDILPDGEIYNPNFQFDTSLQAEDKLEYKAISLNIIAPVLTLLDTLVNMTFIFGPNLRY